MNPPILDHLTAKNALTRAYAADLARDWKGAIAAYQEAQEAIAVQIRVLRAHAQESANG